MAATVKFADPHIRVKDVARAANWYRRMLGLKVETALPDRRRPAFVRMNAGDPAGVAIMISDGSDMLTGKQAPRPVVEAIATRKAQRVVSLYFRVDRDIEQLYRSAKRKGAQVTRALVDQPYGMREFELRDPDGYLVGVGQELA